MVTVSRPEGGDFEIDFSCNEGLGLGILRLCSACLVHTAIILNIYLVTYLSISVSIDKHIPGPLASRTEIGRHGISVGAPARYRRRLKLTPGAVANFRINFVCHWVFLHWCVLQLLNSGYFVRYDMCACSRNRSLYRSCRVRSIRLLADTRFGSHIKSSRGTAGGNGPALRSQARARRMPPQNPRMPLTVLSFFPSFFLSFFLSLSLSHIIISI